MGTCERDHLESGKISLKNISIHSKTNGSWSSATIPSGLFVAAVSAMGAEEFMSSLRRYWLLHWQRFNVALNLLFLFVTRQTQIVVRLQTCPHFRRGAKVARQSQRRVRRDAALLQNNFVNTPGRDMQRPRQRVLRQVTRLHKLLAENFARMDRRQFFDSCPHAFTNVFAQ